MILVNWEPLAASSFYLGPMRNTARVGRNAGEFITFLMKETGAKWTDMHFIGNLSGGIYLFSMFLKFSVVFFIKKVEI